MRDLQLINDYRILDKDLALFYSKINNERDYETNLLIPEKNIKSSLADELGILKERTKAIKKPDQVFELLQEHFMDFIGGQELSVKRKFERPSEHISIFISTFSNLVRKDSRPDVERAEIIIKIFFQADEIWKGVLSWIDEVSFLYLRELVDNCNLFINTMPVEIKKLRMYFPTLNEKQTVELSRAIEKLSSKMTEWIRSTKELMAAKGMVQTTETLDTDTIKFDEDYYRFLLNNNFGIDLNELLSWHDSEVEKTRNEVFEIAAKLKISEPNPKSMKEVNDILIKYAGPCETPEEMFERSKIYLQRARSVCHEFIRLPVDEKCIVTDTPEHLKFSYPWGGCGGMCPRRRPLIGEIFYNRYNFRAVTDGWIKMCSIHEAYPGHHSQFIRTIMDPIPETMKLGAKFIALMEGTAHRSERAFEFVFEEDQFYPLFVAYRRHHTSVRIKADLWLRYFGRPIGDAVKLYVDELDFARNIARGQVKQQENMQGYFNNYYYGMKKLADWENLYGYDKKQFTELLFEPGRISLSNFEKFLKLNEDDKNRLLNEFPSFLESHVSFRF